jgi:hypothetical protein
MQKTQLLQISRMLVPQIWIHCDEREFTCLKEYSNSLTKRGENDYNNIVIVFSGLSRPNSSIRSIGDRFLDTRAY